MGALALIALVLLSKNAQKSTQLSNQRYEILQLQEKLDYSSYKIELSKFKTMLKLQQRDYKDIYNIIYSLDVKKNETKFAGIFEMTSGEVLTSLYKILDIFSSYKNNIREISNKRGQLESTITQLEGELEALKKEGIVTLRFITIRRFDTLDEKGLYDAILYIDNWPQKKVVLIALENEVKPGDIDGFWLSVKNLGEQPMQMKNGYGMSTGTEYFSTYVSVPEEKKPYIKNKALKNAKADLDKFLRNNEKLLQSEETQMKKGIDNEVVKLIEDL